jgi:stage II sporulation protein P
MKLAKYTNKASRKLTRLVAGAVAAVIMPIAAFPESVPLPEPPRRTEPLLLGAFNQTVINNGELWVFATDGEPPPEPPPVPEPPLPPTPVPEPPAGVAVISRNVVHPHEIPTSLVPHSGRIVRRTFRPEQSASSSYVNLGGSARVRNGSAGIANETLRGASRQPLTFTPTRGAQPQVLIIHTHTTESFADVSGTFRSLDNERNIVAVGARLAEEIAAAGFGVIHDAAVHDYPVFNGAYGRSAASIRAILEEFPSIKIVLDIHRDAIESGGSPVAAVADIGGRDAAQIMIISAVDECGGWGVPDFMQNFRFASRLQSRLEQDSPGITRALWFKPCSYNMGLSPGGLLIEIGSHGNTLEQALYSAELLGQSLGRLLEELADS